MRFFRKSDHPIEDDKLKIKRRSSLWKKIHHATLILILFSPLFAFLWTLWGGFYFEGPSPWPKGKILYYNDSSWQETLKAGRDQWNKLHFGVEFKETSNENEADLIIKAGLPCLPECDGMVSNIGYNGVLGTPTIMYLKEPTDNDGVNEVDLSYVDTVTHEFGHVLGLTHKNKECTIMDNKNRECYLDEEPAQVTSKGVKYACGPYAEDLTDLSELYPNAPPLQEKPWCFNPSYTKEEVQEKILTVRYSSCIDIFSEDRCQRLIKKNEFWDIMDAAYRKGKTKADSYQPQQKTKVTPSTPVPLR